MLSISMRSALARLKEEHEVKPYSWHYASMIGQLSKTLDALVNRGLVERKQQPLPAVDYMPQSYSTQYRIKCDENC